MKSSQQLKDWQSLLSYFLGHDFLQDFDSPSHPVTPDIDLYVTNHEVLVVADLPGVENVNEMKIKFNDNKLVLAGKLPSPYQAYEPVCAERRRGLFHKEIQLPVDVNKSKYTAKYRKGVLELRFWKK